MRGYDEFNFPAFDAGTEALRHLGIEVFSPAERDRKEDDFDPSAMKGTDDELVEVGFSLRDALGDDLEYICKEADAVVVLPGWEKSSGANAEVATAKALSLPVYELDALIEFATTTSNWHNFIDECPEVHRASSDQPIQIKAESFTVNVESPRAGSDVAVPLYAPTPNYEFELDLDGLPGPIRWWPEAPATTEVRVTSATGGQKGQKDAQMGAIDPLARDAVARVAGFGTRKYSRGNYLRGFDWSLCIDALHRHISAFEAGEDLDPESGECHAAHAAWQALALTSFFLRGIGTDDRYTEANLEEARTQES